MEYVGEHLWAGQLGRAFSSLAFVGALVAAIAYLLYHQKEIAGYGKLARGAFWAHAVGVLGVVGMLFYIMLQQYYEYNYVFEHTSNALPLRYMFSAFWEGQEGSFILWLFWHVVLGLILMYTARKWEAPVMAVFAAVQGFLASMILGLYPLGVKIGSSPFVLMRHVPENIGAPWTEVADYLERFPAFMDGAGLNPLLQNYWMTIHPPVLFLGFASTLVPFAFGIAALLRGDFKSWVKPALPWTFFSVGILGLGILMGGAWAYEALSFGGFWAWDPVENSSLVPWLIIVGAAHLLLIYRHKRTGLRAAFALSLLGFLLVLYSTFLTRSGVLGDSSVHAFVDLGMSGQLLIYLGFFVLVALGLMAYRWKQIPSAKGDDNLSSREFWMFIGSLTLLVSGFQIIFSTSIPVINKLIGPEGVLPLMGDKMAPPLDAIEHYNSFQVPFAIIIVGLIAVGQFLNYGKTNAHLFWRSFRRSAIITLLLSALLAQLYGFWNQPIYLVLLVTSILAAVSNLDYWLVKGRGRLTLSGSSVAHLGIGLLLLGALISNAKQSVISSSRVFLSEDLPANENALMELGDTIPLGPYTAVFQGMSDSIQKQYYTVQYLSDTSAEADSLFTLHPYLQMSDNMGPTPNPDTRHYWDKDLYTHVTYSSYLEPETEDGYTDEQEVLLGQGDTAIYKNHFIVLDSLMVNAGMNEETGQVQRIRLTAAARLINVMGQEFTLRPSYKIEGNQESFEDAVMDSLGYKFRFASVEQETKRIKITAWSEANAEEKPFIVMKAIVFPLINILWLGSILMVIGTGLAIYQRVVKKG